MPKLLQSFAAVVAAAGLMMGASAAFAIDAVAKSSVNVRTGPGTTYSIVDKLEADEAVSISECAPNGWCFIEHSGPDGWVSASFLTAPDDSYTEESDGGGSNPDCGFGFSMGSGGPSLSINCGDETPAPAPAEPSYDEADAQACFYVSANFEGASFCMGEGTKNALNGTFNDKISSIELSGGLKARLCVNSNLGGYCKNVNSDTEELASQINNKASSLIVYSGALPADEPEAEPEPMPEPDPVDVTPDTYSTGPIGWKQTWEIDLDTGSQGSDAGTDLWYEAVNDTTKYMKPIHGAKIAIGDGSQHGFDGCSSATYSSAKLSLDDAPIGSYICVKTDEGRISEYRVNGYAGTTMNIGYTTWSN